MDKLLLMLQLQNQLNNATNGENWVKGITKNQKTINWRRCIYMESAEMIDCFAWKHWKNIEADPDWDNLKIEVVDVWHFVMSLAIQYYHQEFKGGIEEIALHMAQLEKFALIDTEELHYATPNAVMQKVEDIMRDVLSLEKLDLNALIEHFFELTSMSELNLSSLYTLYIGKNILNQFRQDNGYKEGNYIKTWNGQEDNVWMQKILEEEPDIKPDILYKKLAKLYHQVTEA
jgi:dimeric dUTPase (all-alpha-NTP-PPase superfamily)